jgi:hypothetical protein
VSPYALEDADSVRITELPGLFPVAVPISIAVMGWPPFLWSASNAASASFNVNFGNSAL